MKKYGIISENGRKQLKEQLQQDINPLAGKFKKCQEN